MILLKLLLALVLERIWPRAPHWHWHFGFVRWLDWWLSTCNTRPVAGLLAALLLPPVLAAGLLAMLPGPLAFLLELLLLLMLLGNPWLQELYRRYLRALSRGDRTRSLDCVREFARFRHPDRPGELGTVEVAGSLAWINYRFYFAVIFFYLVSGVPGVVLYGSLVSARRLLLERDGFRELACRLQLALRCLDWLPARLMMLGYVVMGEPGRSLSVWLASLFGWRRPESEWLADVARAAANLDTAVDPMHVQVTGHLVVLAKRTVVLFLGVIALMTLYGGVA